MPKFSLKILQKSHFLGFTAWLSWCFADFMGRGLVCHSYQLQKYYGHGSYVVPVDPKDMQTWADKDHRLAQVSETTVIHPHVVEVQVLCCSCEFYVCVVHQ